MKIDPGMCPLCGNPICTNIPFVCSEVCIHSSLKSGCYQLGGNQDYGKCKCSYNDIMDFLGGTFRKNIGKEYEIAELMVAKLQGKDKIGEILPDKLFEL